MSDQCRHCEQCIRYMPGIGWRHCATKSVYCGLDGEQRATPKR